MLVRNLESRNLEKMTIQDVMFSILPAELWCAMNMSVHVTSVS
jgi:hypothetical protein